MSHPVTSLPFPARRAAGLLWILAVVAAATNVVDLVRNAKPWGVDWRAPGGTLLDFRDLIVVPGRYLWQGGNPYDPVPYLAAHPWAQEFDPYSPAWLLISAGIGWMPLPVAATVYLTCMTAVSFHLARRLAQWTCPRRAIWLSPLVALWFQIWFPARGMGSSFLVAFGMVLAVTLMDRPQNDRRSAWLAAVGLSLAVLKPQFGLPFALLLLAARQYRLVFRAVLITLISSAAPLIACVVASGGVPEFLASIHRVILHASSPDAPTGLLAADSYRIDLPGMITRVTGTPPGPWAAISAGVCFALVLAVIGWRAPRGEYVAMLGAPAILLLPVHLSYDIILAVMPLAAGLRLYRLAHYRWWLVPALLCGLAVAHLHRISALFGLGKTGADMLDWLATSLSLVASVCVLLIWHPHPSTPVSDPVDA